MTDDLDRKQILDAIDQLNYARDMVQLIETCGHRPTGSTAFVAGERIQDALDVLHAVVKGGAV